MRIVMGESFTPNTTTLSEVGSGKDKSEQVQGQFRGGSLSVRGRHHYVDVI